MFSEEFYNPLNTFYKSVTGAVKEGKKIRFRVKGNFGSVFLVLKKDGEKETYLKMKKFTGFFEIFLSFEKGLYWYRFCADEKIYGVNGNKTDCYQLSVYSKRYRTPDWIKGGIIYQIFPDRFNRFNGKVLQTDRCIHDNLQDVPNFAPDSNGEVKNDDFFGGNLKGITEKLPYLKSLNISAIYLNPIFKAYSNHRYDTGDYFSIDPLLGSEEDLKDLINSADKLGIKIILDGVFNHVGADSIYFNKYGNYNSVGAYQSKNSKYFSWFDFSEYPGVYRCWWDIKTLPTVNKNDEFVEMICGKTGVIKKYADMGIKGLRLDVVDELPSFFVKRIRKTIKNSDEKAFLIGEVWEDASNKISYGIRREYFLGEELDSVMNYPLKNAIIKFILEKDSSYLSKTVNEQIDHYPKKALDCLMNILSTHDTERILSVLSGIRKESLTKAQDARFILSGDLRKEALFNLKAAVLLQYTLYGVPSIYYGDEAGLEGFYDPINRKYFPWNNIDTEINSWYKKLGKLRSMVNVFKEGNFKELYKSKSAYVFKRSTKTEDAIIALNLGDKPIKFNFKDKIFDFIRENFYTNEFILPSKNFAVFLKNPINSVDNVKSIC